jgi:hypothetical protein
VKNREAAQQFRLRQKQYIEDLEVKVAGLTRENADSKARLELLLSENKLIKEQLAYVRNFISQAISASFNPAAALSNMQNNPAFMQNMMTAFSSMMANSNSNGQPGLIPPTDGTPNGLPVSFPIFIEKKANIVTAQLSRPHRLI